MTGRRYIKTLAVIKIWGVDVVVGQKWRNEIKTRWWKIWRMWGVWQLSNAENCQAFSSISRAVSRSTLDLLLIPRLKWVFYDWPAPLCNMYWCFLLGSRSMRRWVWQPRQRSARFHFYCHHHHPRPSATRTRMVSLLYQDWWKCFGELNGFRCGEGNRRKSGGGRWSLLHWCVWGDDPYLIWPWSRPKKSSQGDWNGSPGIVVARRRTTKIAVYCFLSAHFHNYLKVAPIKKFLQEKAQKRNVLECDGMIVALR